MNEDDVQLVPGIIRDVVYQILATEVWGAILKLVNGQEAGITAFKQHLKRTKIGWDAAKIKWGASRGLQGHV
jgi:hypothetical protein